MKRIISCLILILSFTGISRAQQCTADFTTSTAPGNPNTIVFSNISSNLVQAFDSVNYFWDFGDGNFSGMWNTMHTYANPGSYQVCLTMLVMDTGGVILCSDTTCKTLVIPGQGNCIANFITSPSGVNPSNIQFIDSSVVTNPSPTDSILISWNFGDGNFGVSAYNGSIFHTYNTTGVFNVCMSVLVTDSVGDTVCFDSICKNITVSGIPINCAAGFRWTIDSANPRAYTFIDTSTFSAPGVGSVDSIVWEFGDGNQAFGDSVVHTYAQNGAYNVCQTIYLISQGSVICSDTICVSITVNVIPDFCSIEYIIDTVNSYNGVVYIWNLGDSLNPNTINTYQWNFGDGSFSNQAYPTHNYSLTGDYEVCLTITAINPNQDTCVKTYCDTIKVDPNGGLTNIGAGFTLNVLNPLTIGINEFKSGAMQVYPNPASSFVKLDMGSINAKEVVWMIHDMKGSQVLSGVFNAKKEGIKRIDVSKLNAGIYLISVKDNSSVSQKKLKIIRW